MPVDALFDCIVRLQAGRSFGACLDAGTGVESFQWLQQLQLQQQLTSITAITADEGMKRSMEKALKGPLDGVKVGSWTDASFCSSLGKYDTILADYLIGAVDGFTPYTQDLILNTLKNHLNENGR